MRAGVGQPVGSSEEVSVLSESVVGCSEEAEALSEGVVVGGGSGGTGGGIVGGGVQEAGRGVVVEVALIPVSVRIRVIRALMGFTQARFAMAVSSNIVSIREWERGERCIRPESWRKIALFCREMGIGMLKSGMPVPTQKFFNIIEKRERGD